MKAFAAVLFLCLLPICTPLRCYICSSLNSACGEPFDPTGSGVTIQNSSAFTYCLKTKAISLVTRTGAPMCVATSTDANNYISCCQTDLCNGISSQYQTPIFLVLGIVILFLKFQYD